MSSVTLVHTAKAVGRNEMPFGGDTHVVQSNIVLDRGFVPPTGRGDLGVITPIRSDATYRQITLALVKTVVTCKIKHLQMFCKCFILHVTTVLTRAKVIWR